MNKLTEIENEVLVFIKEWTAYSNITPQTLVDRDLGMYGTDCVEFLSGFSEKFKMNFDVSYIFALIKLVKDIYHGRKITFFYSVDVSVADLILSAQKGYWSPEDSYHARVRA